MRIGMTISIIYVCTVPRCGGEHHTEPLREAGHLDEGAAGSLAAGAGRPGGEAEGRSEERGPGAAPLGEA